jgi:hypothetical protein
MCVSEREERARERGRDGVYMQQVCFPLQRYGARIAPVAGVVVRVKKRHYRGALFGRAGYEQKQFDNWWRKGRDKKRRESISRTE